MLTHLDKTVWNCPLDLKEGERIVLYESYLRAELGATVVDVIAGIVSVCVDGFPNSCCSINPMVTAWRRETTAFAWPDMSNLFPVAETYGATCANPNCYVKFYPDAVNRPGFKCYECRSHE